MGSGQWATGSLQFGIWNLGLGILDFGFGNFYKKNPQVLLTCGFFIYYKLFTIHCSQLPIHSPHQIFLLTSKFSSSLHTAFKKVEPNAPSIIL